MQRDTTEPAAEATEEKLFDNWFDPVETILRSKMRDFLETMIDEELETALARPRRSPASAQSRPNDGDRAARSSPRLADIRHRPLQLSTARFSLSRPRSFSDHPPGFPDSILPGAPRSLS